MLEREIYTPKQAAAFLTNECGFEVDIGDVFQLVGDGKLSLSWEFHYVPVLEVFPVCHLDGAFEDPDFFVDLPRHEGYETGERIRLLGYARIPMERNDQLREWSLAARLGKTPVQISHEGVILEGGDGALYQAIEDWGDQYSATPKIDPVPSDQFVFQRGDLVACVDLLRSMSPAQCGATEPPELVADSAGTIEREGEGRVTDTDSAYVFMQGIQSENRCATAKALFNLIEQRASAPSFPFSKGQGANRGKLIISATGVPISLKTVQNNWGRINSHAPVSGESRELRERAKE